MLDLARQVGIPHVLLAEIIHPEEYPHGGIAIRQLENEAASEGFTFSYQIGFNGFGRKAVQMMAVLKKLT